MAEPPGRRPYEILIARNTIKSYTFLPTNVGNIMAKKVFISYNHKQGEWVWDKLVPYATAQRSSAQVTEVIDSVLSALVSLWLHLCIIQVRKTRWATAVGLHEARNPHFVDACAKGLEVYPGRSHQLLTLPLTFHNTVGIFATTSFHI